MTTRWMTALAAAALTLAATPAALAGEAGLATPAVVATKRVSTAGMDFASPKDAQKVYRRLRHAAKEVCAYSSATHAYSRDCARQALDASVARLNEPAVDALHRTARRG